MTLDAQRERERERESNSSQNSSRWLIAALIFLCLAIAGLVVGIVVVNSQGGNAETKQSETEYELPEELMGDDLSPTDQVIKETSIMLQNPNYDNEDIEAYYDAVVDGALSEGDTDLAMRTIIQKMNFIAVIEGDCAKAKEYVNAVDLEPYSAAEKSYLASYVLSAAEGCSGGELQAKWESLYNGAKEE